MRKLAAEVYGAHEQNGNWNDEGEWHVVGDEDLESSDDDLLGSDVESSSDDHEELDFFGAPDVAGDDSSGDDYDSMDDEDDDGQGADWLARLSHVSQKPVPRSSHACFRAQCMQLLRKPCNAQQACPMAEVKYSKYLESTRHAVHFWPCVTSGIPGLLHVCTL